jgi:hypothetical protein
LFEGRPIVSAYDMLPALEVQVPSVALTATQRTLWEGVNLEALGLVRSSPDPPAIWEVQEVQVLPARAFVCSLSAAL